MRKLVIMATICGLFAMVLSSCTKPRVREKDVGETIHDTFMIKHARSYEECIELRPGMVFDYDYEASDFVNFNIHYHAADTVHYPVSKKGVKWGRGMIDPGKHDYYTEEQEAYCLMWDNTNYESVKVSFRCVLREK